MGRTYDVFILDFNEAEARRIRDVVRDVLSDHIPIGEVHIIENEEDFPRRSFNILIVRARSLQDIVDWTVTNTIDDEYDHEMWDLIVAYNNEVATSGCFKYSKELCSRIRECI